jgi:dTDP-4-dehydrorhamnose 3,5-epimerase
MHFQIDQTVGPKLLTVSRGALIDFAVDIRTESPTYGVAFTTVIMAVKPAVLKIPRGFAHGYQTLEENTSLLYWLDEQAGPGSHLGYNPLSPCVRDFWPIKDGIIVSEKDDSSPHFEFESLEVQEIYPDVS